MQITVKDRQSLADIAVQYLGGVEGIFALAERNGISITAKLKDGQTLDWELADTVDATVQKTYAAQGIEPATDIPQKEMEALLTATKKYFAGCIIPRPPRRELTIVDEVTAAKGWTLSGIGSQFDSGTYTQTEREDGIVVNRAKKVIKQLSEGKEVTSESGQTLARIFGNQFDDTFA
ncbi:LysM domain-containing protein [uncultured Prevotella sp.]|jgi:hypothetical protein|uniref:LysM peptidoglycan-binding domain-containing protein n=1 Tax=uncultured Prevotella sp. TaxID=159272 RepID=UPI0025F641AB|nr:LysM domain-containing protein [uncultured Prevotella sp.]